MLQLVNTESKIKNNNKAKIKSKNKSITKSKTKPKTKNTQKQRPRPRQKKQKPVSRPRILFLTPEISQVPSGMCNGAEHIRAKAGGMADISASLVSQLYGQDADVHLAVPHYRNLFKNNQENSTDEPKSLSSNSRVYLAEDDAFHQHISAYHGDLHAASLAFQREVINHIIPSVKPDIVHCNDWMTGLIPAACKKLGIKTIFTIHNIHRERTTLAEIQNFGIDPSEYWEKLYYDHANYSFDESYHHNTIDMLSSAIINADYVTTVSPTFLQEIIHGTHGELPDSVKSDLFTKIDVGYAKGILNAPDPSFAPNHDKVITQKYSYDTHQESKRINKSSLQEKLGLRINNEAPILFWPSRLDPIQKGCQLLTDILFQTLSDYDDVDLQLVIVGDGSFQGHFHDIVEKHQLHDRVAVRDFDESLSRLAFAGSDFVLMPSSFEPCGLPQMIGAFYGTLPIVHNTGGLHDTVEMLENEYTEGNGIVFDHFDSNGLRWAIDRAMDFYRAPDDIKKATITRVMSEANIRFSNEAMFQEYADAYTKLASDKSA